MVSLKVSSGDISKNLLSGCFLEKSTHNGSSNHPRLEDQTLQDSSAVRPGDILDMPLVRHYSSTAASTWIMPTPGPKAYKSALL